MANIYDDVEALKKQMNDVLTAIEDTGWINLTLLNGVQPFSIAQIPQYRRIGKKVILRGSVKNITAKNTIIALLPPGLRPSQFFSFIQNTSVKNGSTNYARWQVRDSGEIKLEGISEGVTANWEPTNWYPIDCEFYLD